MYADDNIHCFNKDSDNVVFSCNVMSILNKDLNNINLNDTNYGKNDPETIIQVRLLVWRIKFEKRHKELIPTERHPKRWWNLCIP